jgi:hypothetical protein
VSLITERRISRLWGLWGGGPGAPRENWLPDKCTIRLHAGDVLRMLTPVVEAGVQHRTPEPNRPAGSPAMRYPHQRRRPSLCAR